MQFPNSRSVRGTPGQQVGKGEYKGSQENQENQEIRKIREIRFQLHSRDIFAPWPSWGSSPGSQSQEDREENLEKRGISGRGSQAALAFRT